MGSKSALMPISRAAVTCATVGGDYSQDFEVLVGALRSVVVCIFPSALGIIAQTLH